MENTITYVAMDTHKKQHKIALRKESQGLHYPCQEEIVEFTIGNTVRDIKKMVNKIKKQAPGEVEFCYEAGVCGFTLKRRIEQFDCRCCVIAPSLVPRKPRRMGKFVAHADCLLFHLSPGIVWRNIDVPDSVAVIISFWCRPHGRLVPSGHVAHATEILLLLINWKRVAD